MFLFVVGAHSIWIEAVPKGNSSSVLTTIRNLRKLVSTLGIPEIIVPDNRTSFTGQELNNFTKSNDINHLTTVPYHAAFNGCADRAVQTVKKRTLRPQADVQSPATQHGRTGSCKTACDGPAI